MTTNKYTLKELTEIGSKAACLDTAGAVDLHPNCREAFIKAILDAIGYQLPKDEEREAFDKWQKKTGWDLRDSTFEAWKAGREELRKKLCSDKCEENKADTSKTRQYFWRNEYCKAAHASDPKCRCWHDEGRGPLKAFECEIFQALEWRDKPDALSK